MHPPCDSASLSNTLDRWPCFLGTASSMAGHGSSALGSDQGKLNDDEADREAMQRLAAGDTGACSASAFRSLEATFTQFFISIAWARMPTPRTSSSKPSKSSIGRHPRYRPEARFASWLFAIARNELRHELRRRRRKPLDPGGTRATRMGGWKRDDRSRTAHPRTGGRTPASVADATGKTTQCPSSDGGRRSFRSRKSPKAWECPSTALYVTLHRARKNLRDALTILTMNNECPRPILKIPTIETGRRPWLTTPIDIAGIGKAIR